MNHKWFTWGVSLKRSLNKYNLRGRHKLCWDAWRAHMSRAKWSCRFWRPERPTAMFCVDYPSSQTLVALKLLRTCLMTSALRTLFRPAGWPYLWLFCSSLGTSLGLLVPLSHTPISSGMGFKPTAAFWCTVVVSMCWMSAWPSQLYWGTGGAEAPAKQVDVCSG